MILENKGIDGFDLSFYQDPKITPEIIDFNKMKQWGADFVIIKAGQDTYSDPAFSTSWANAKKAGLPRSAYWFGDKDSSGKSQALLFWNLIKADIPEGMCFVDYEEGSWTDWNELYNFIVEFQRLSGLPNYKVGIYTGYPYWTAHSPLNSASKQWFANYPLWLAWYTNYPEKIIVPAPWSQCLVWQKGTPAIGLQVGVESLEVDYDIFNGDAIKAAKYMGVGSFVEPVDPEPQPQPQPSVTGNKYKCIATAGLNIRSTPAGTIIGVLKYGEVVDEIIKNPDGSWIQIKRSDGLIGWCSAQWLAWISIPTQTSTFLLPLPSGSIKQIKHDHEAKDGLQRIGMPEVLGLSLNNYSDLTEAWQWYWFRLLIHAYTNYQHWDEKRLSRVELDMLKGKWRSLTKHSEAFTNFKGTDTNKDYITPNTKSGLPGHEPLTCGGNIVRVMGSSVRVAGKTVVPIETLDGGKNPPPIEKVNRLTRPDLILVATNVAADKSDGYPWKPIILADGSYEVDPFPQMMDTPFILHTKGNEANNFKNNTPIRPAGTYSRDGINYAYNYILESRLKAVSGTNVPTPYNIP